MVTPPTDDLHNPVHWLMAACMSLLGISGWFARRSVKRMEDDIANNATAIEALREGRVTSKDFDELRGSMTASITTAFELLDKSVERRHSENRADRESLLSGIRSEIESVRQDVRELWKVKRGSN